ncbi:hypothetical protein NC652_000021 [Populus alba x Populus x berolinensis]|nr:hypothetical protein NC652_000021 [Populus alba x Populus x berolinensis]
MESESKEDQGALDNVHGTSRQGKRTNFDDCGSKTMNSPAKIHSDTMRHNAETISKRHCEHYLLWWANRDSIPDDATSRGVPATSALPHLSIGNSGKDNLQLAISKTTVVPTSDTSMPTTDHPKVDITNGPEEELRKKQELLDQKRNDFRRQLHKLEKQATGVKGEVATEPASKRQKTGIASDLITTRSADPGAGVASPHAGIVDKNKRMENIVSSRTKTSTVMALQESAGSKQSIHPLVPVGPPFLMNKYKVGQPTHSV